MYDDKSTVSLWASQIADSEECQAEPSDMRHSGRSTAVTQALLQGADELIQDYPRITTRKPETKLSVSSGSVNTIIDALGDSKVCDRWVPRSLPDYDKTGQ
jgi:hypothetical protein